MKLLKDIIKEDQSNSVEELQMMRERISRMVDSVFDNDTLNLSRDSHRKLIEVKKAFDALFDSMSDGR